MLRKLRRGTKIGIRYSVFGIRFPQKITSSSTPHFLWIIFGVESSCLKGVLN